MDGKTSIDPSTSTPAGADDEPLLAKIASALAACAGAEFFDSLVCYLTRLLGVDFAYVGELTGHRHDRVRTLSVCARGVGTDNITYDIAPTPCLIVVADGFSAYNREVQRLFPDDRLAAELGVESYMGIALRAASGEVLGLLTVMDSKPLANPRAAEWILRLFSLRAAAELERLRSEQRRELAEQRFRSTLALPLVGIAVTAPDKRWLEVNDRLCEILGYPRAELLDARWDEISHDAELPRNLALFERALRGEIDGYSLDKRFVRKDGTLVDVRLSARCVRGPDGRTEHFVLLVDDITERLQTRERLRYLAQHDVLTRLPNRTLLMERLAQTLAWARRDGRRVAVLCIGLDRFKQFNELLGHHTGDRLLGLAAERLAAGVPPGTTVARLGGDEFAIVLADIVCAADATPAANRVLAAFAEPFVLDGRELFLGASIGIGLGPDDADQADVLLRQADAALSRAKQAGRNTFRFYAAGMNRNALENLALEADLRRALDRNQLCLYYQPQVEAERGGIVGVEALLRWRHPQLGVLEPGRFLALAEEIGLTLAIGAWVLRTAVTQAQAWRRAGHLSLRMSVNLSGRQFTEPAFVESIGPLLDETGLAAAALELEITEDVIMQDAPATIERLRILHAMGVRFAIDDFGTGYSSLSYLTRFRVHTLKIDQSFVRDLTGHGQAAEIARTVIALGHSLGLQVVAEGVETAGQLAILRTLGCDLLQGYYFSQPLPADETTKLLEAPHLGS